MKESKQNLVRKTERTDLSVSMEKADGTCQIDVVKKYDCLIAICSYRLNSCPVDRLFELKVYLKGKLLNGVPLRVSVKRLVRINGRFIGKWYLREAANDVAAPNRIAISKDGTVYVTDSSNHRVLGYDSGGILIRKWGAKGNANGYFNGPRGIAILQDELFVCDKDNHRIQVFDLFGQFVRCWGTRGDRDGQLNEPPLESSASLISVRI